MRRLVVVLLFASLVALTQGAASAAAATLSFAPSADPAQDKPISIAISGTTETGRSLWAYISSGSVTCSATAATNTGTLLTSYYGDYFNTGPFAKVVSYTPTSIGMYTLCGYLGSSSAGTPPASATATFSVRRANGSLTIKPAADPAQDKAMTIATTGNAEVGRSFYAYVQSGSVTCPDTAATNPGALLTSYYGDYQQPGDFADQASYTPSAVGTYTICGYLSRSSAGTPDATARATFTARRAHGTLSFSAPASLQRPASAQVTVSGTAEVSRTLYVYAQSTGGCAESPAGNQGPVLTSYYGEYVSAGEFTERVTFQPGTAGTWALCAYLTKSSATTPDATATAAIAVSPDPNAPAPQPEIADDPFGKRQPVPAPALSSPAPDASAELFKPTFTWATWEGWRSSDRMTLSRRESDGSTSKLITLAFSRYSSYYDDEYEEEETEDDTEEVATFTNDDTSVSVRLMQPLPPGTYTWFVVRALGAETLRSEERSFTVLGPRVQSLSINDRSSRGRTSKYPGSSSISIRTAAYARVRIELRRQGRVQPLYFTADDSGAVDLTIPWSCARAGGTYRYSVRATDQYGTQRTRSGTFTPVSRGACRSMRAKEAAARREATRRRLARQRAAARREARRIARLEARFRTNCRAIGGTPADIDTGDGPKVICRSPFGGLLNVPM